MKLTFDQSKGEIARLVKHSAPDRDLHHRQIAATDHQIDALVYDLYGLTAAEIKIVDESSGTHS